MQIGLGVSLGLLLTLLLIGRNGPGLEGGTASGARDPLLPEPYPAAELDLRDPDGRRVRLSDLRGRIVAVFFGYTSCPDVCPLTLARLAAYGAEAAGPGGPKGGDPGLMVVFVSVDPARDTPDRLRSFAGSFGTPILALTAEEDEVRRQANRFGVLVRERPLGDGPDAGYLVDHTARTYVLDPDGQIVASIPPMASPGEVEETMDAVVREVRRRRTSTVQREDERGLGSGPVPPVL